MRKKILGILLMGLLISTILPVVSAVNQPKLPPQIQIEIRGGLGFHAYIKNVGTNDINDAKITATISGPFIARGCRHFEGTIDLKAGKTAHHIFVVLGFGPADVEIKINSIAQSASGKVFGYLALGVK